MSVPSPAVVHVYRVAAEESLLPSVSPVILLKVAREIAADIRPLDDILKIHGLTDDDWEQLKTEHRFKVARNNAVAEWQSVANTTDRVRVKSLAFVEEALPEFYARAHDPKESLTAKVEVLKTIAKIAGISERAADAGTGGARMSVTINLGADHKLTIEKDITPVTAQGTSDEEDEEDRLLLRNSFARTASALSSTAPTACGRCESCTTKMATRWTTSRTLRSPRSPAPSCCSPAPPT